MENEIKEQSKNPNKKVITFRKNDVSYEVMLNFNENQINMFDDQETIPCFCGD